MSLQDSILEWYTWKLSNFDCNALNKDAGIKCWINIFSYRFKVPTSIALDFFIDKSYLLENAWASCPLALYVQAIIHHGIGYNIIDMAN